MVIDANLPPSIESLPLLIYRGIFLAFGRYILIYVPNAPYVVDTMTFPHK
jgi:hypothetical protein